MIDSTRCTVAALIACLAMVACRECGMDCPDDIERIVCAFDAMQKTYKVFTSECALKVHNDCNNEAFTRTPFKFCVKQHFNSRRSYYESCPMFCPEYYRPVCGAAQYRDYNYRSFINICFFDMLNCRGEEDDGYIQVPLSYCPRHAMKNLFKEKVVAMNLHNNEDY